MTSFSQLSCEQLIRREGFDCACGRHHACALDYLKIGSGAVRYAADMLRAMGCEKPYILCDKNTWAAAGGQVTASLDAAGISYTVHMIPGERPAPAEWEVGSALLHYDSSCDAVMGVGSGVINDISKVLSHAVGVKSCIVGTAPSMDGYASDSAAMEIDQVKSTLFVNVPRGILLDTDILAQAPMRMLQAGFGDVLAKFTALSEWQIARIVNGEAYCDEIAALMRTALDRVVAAVPGIPARDPEAVRSIAEGLVISGIAMAFAGVSRPASGQEHYFSHMWEMMALERGKPYDLHGIQVGVGTLLTIAICERLR